MFSREFDIANDMSVKPSSLIGPNRPAKPVQQQPPLPDWPLHLKTLWPVSANLDNGLNDISGKSGITAVGTVQATTIPMTIPVMTIRAGIAMPIAAPIIGATATGRPHQADRSDNEPRDHGTAHRDDQRDATRVQTIREMTVITKTPRRRTSPLPTIIKETVRLKAMMEVVKTSKPQPDENSVPAKPDRAAILRRPQVPWTTVVINAVGGCSSRASSK